MSSEQPSRHLIITVHGIRTFGGWQERLEQLVHDSSPGTCVVEHYKYGYFSALAFMLPFLRWLVTRRFRRDVLERIAAEEWLRIDIVAHSFGTHLVGWGLHGLESAKRPKVHTLILAGSVLKAGFPWRELMSASVGRLVNECGTRDSVLVLNQALVLFTGMAGRTGFNGLTSERFRNRYFDFGHSGYFMTGSVADDRFIRDRWVPLLTGEAPIAMVSDTRSQGPFAGAMTFVLNNAEPIKLALVAVPLIAAYLYVYGLYREAEHQRSVAEAQRRTAVARRLVAEAASLQALDGQVIERSILLATEAMKRDPSIDSYQTLLAGISLMPHRIASIDVQKDSRQLSRLSPDGRSLLIVSQFSRANENSRFEMRVCSVETGKEVGSVVRGGGSVDEAEFSPDGRSVVIRTRSSGSPIDGALEVWDIANNTARTRISEPGGGTGLSFTPDGMKMAIGGLSGGWANTVRIVDARSGAEDNRFSIGKVHLNALSFDDTGRYVRTVDSESWVRTWAIGSGRLQDQFRIQAHCSPHCVFSADGRWIAAFGDRTVSVYDASTGEESFRRPAIGRTASLTADGQYLGLNGVRSSEIWHVPSDVEVARIGGREDVFNIGALAPYGRFFLRTDDKKVELWALDDVQRLPSSIRADDVMRLTDDGSHLVASIIEAGAATHSVMVMDLQNGTLVRTANVARYEFDVPSGAIAYSIRSGLLAAVVGTKNRVSLWNSQGEQLAEGEIPFAFPHEGGVLDIALSADGQLLAASVVHATADSILSVRRISDGETNFVRPLESADSLNFDSSGNRLAACVRAGRDYFGVIWDASSGEERLRSAGGPQRCIAKISPDGGRLAMAGGGTRNLIRVLETGTGTELTVLNHDESVLTMAFSPDSRHIASASGDGWVHFWEVETGRELGRVKIVSEPTPKLAFTASGDGIVVIEGYDHRVLRFKWRVNDLIDEACARVNRNLSEVEWRRYVGDEPYRETCPAIRQLVPGN